MKESARAPGPRARIRAEDSRSIGYPNCPDAEQQANSIRRDDTVLKGSERAVGRGSPLHGRRNCAAESRLQKCRRG